MLKKAFIITLLTSNAAYSMQPSPAETARAHAELENNKNLILCSHYCPGKNRLASLDDTANITSGTLNLLIRAYFKLMPEIFRQALQAVQMVIF